MKDSAYQWETLFERMYSNNKKGNINEISLEKQSVTGIPSNTTDLRGNNLAPKLAASVTAPRAQTPPIPEVFKQTTPLGSHEETDEEEEEMKRRRSLSRGRKKASSSPKKRKRSTSSKKKTGGKRSNKKGGKSRTRSRITK